MIFSNEPGYYKTGRYGFRIENLVVVAEDKLASRGERTFYCLKQLTFVPVDTKLIDIGLLADTEIAWINGYHAAIRKRLLPFLDRKTAAWLRKATRRIR